MLILTPFPALLVGCEHVDSLDLTDHFTAVTIGNVNASLLNKSRLYYYLSCSLHNVNFIYINSINKIKELIKFRVIFSLFVPILFTMAVNYLGKYIEIKVMSKFVQKLSLKT